MAIENFAVGTLIIPMDVAYQNAGMFKAYGLVYNLLSNGIPVKWAIQPGKTFGGTDFTASAQDIVTLASIVNHNYSGGPFIIDSAYAATALPFITAWQALYPSVAVHRATAAFSADIAATLTRAPRIAIESGPDEDYLNLARIPDSLGNVWSSSSPGNLTSTEMANGALFNYDTSTCKRIAYDILLLPHTGTNWGAEPIHTQLNDFLKRGGYLNARCHTVPLMEAIGGGGPFLTTAGMPTTDIDKGDDGTFTVDVPDYPVAQAVSTGRVQTLYGGGWQSVYHNTPGLIYNPQTQVLAHFVQTSTGKQYDWSYAGPYLLNGTTPGAGKISYEGSHDYSPKEPYTSDDGNLYTRFVLNAVFFAIAKPLLYLNSSPSPLMSGAVNTITFTVYNAGGSPAPNTGFTVTLAPGVTYNVGSATIPPTSVVGQTITWSPAAIGTAPPGTVLTFTADFIPPAPVVTKLADYSTTFDDTFAESYQMLDACITTEVAPLLVADVTAVKTVDKAYAQATDILTYTVTITNNGPNTALNVVFTDPTPVGSTFVLNSVTINGVPAPGADPSVGIPLGILPPPPPPANTAVITWQVTVGDNTPIIDIVNQGTVDYDFVDPIFGPFHSQTLTNEVITQVEKGDLTTVKSSDKTAATVSDTITYTVVVTNTGTVPANNVYFTDTAPNGTSFIPGSVTVDGTPVPGDPGIPPGILLGSIPVGGSVTVTFQVHVDFIPPSPPTPPIAANTAKLDFTYRVNPAGPDLTGVDLSNPAITELLTPELTVVKSADVTAADLGQTITYTVTVTNTGDVTAQAVVLTDPVPPGTTFVPNSVTVGGFLVPGADPNVGIPLGDIPPGGSVIVTFRVTATSLPVPNPTPNTATAAGLFTIEPTELPRSLAFDSNVVEVQIENAVLTPVKSVDKAFAEVCNTLTYTVVVTNTGTIVANNVVFTDNPPNGTSFVPNSVTVNGSPVIGADPSVGVPLGSIPVGGFATVTFKVHVDVVPVPNPTTNIGTVAADFPVNPQSPIHKTFDTNPVDTKVEVVDITLLKSADKEYVEVGDTLTYTVVVTNIGTVPVDNVLFTDVPPTGTTYIPETFRLNGVLQPGADPNVGVNIGSIAPGGFKTVSFRVTVDVLPPGGQITNTAAAAFEFKVDPNGPTESRTKTSNPVTTNVELVQLQVIKDVDKTVAVVGDTLTYTVNIANTGTVTALDAVFTDVLSTTRVSFVENSVLVNGVAQPGANPLTGIPLGDIPPGGFATVVFSVVVESRPEPPEVIDVAVIDFNVRIDPEGPISPRTAESEPVSTRIELVQVTAVKTADKAAVQVGDTLCYTIAVTNTGTVPVDNVIFKDQKPLGTKLVPNSVTVDGVVQPEANITIGVPIGTIQPGQTVLVKFCVTIESMPCPPELINQATITYDYRLEPTGPVVSGSTTSNQTLTDVGLRIFKQLSIDETLTIPEQKPDAETLLDVMVDVEITATRIIETPVVTSYEGQRLTGWKILVEGKLVQKVVYIADVPSQSIHAAHFDVPFSTFLVLPADFTLCQKIRVVGYIEDVYSELLDARTIFKNVTLRIEGIKDCI